MTSSIIIDLTQDMCQYYSSAEDFITQRIAEMPKGVLYVVRSLEDTCRVYSIPASIGDWEAITDDHVCVTKQSAVDHVLFLLGDQS
jgi:hypothetical protein